MGKEYKEIDSGLQQWIERQKLFFVSTAPLSGEGLINCSPKGLDGLRVTSPKQLVYADAGGSGIETVAHLKENGRIVIMMCAFEGPPKIFRFYGQGRSVEAGSEEFVQLESLFPDMQKIRNFIVVDVARIRDACGFGVPVYEYKAERDALWAWHDNKTPEQLATYQRDNNAKSLDGLPGLDLESTPGRG